MLLARRVLRAVSIRPRLRDWMETAYAAAVLAAAAPMFVATGLWRLGAPDLTGLPGLAFLLLLTPALLEELVFRAALIPDRSEAPNVVLAIFMSSAVFVLWHPLEAFTFLPEARDLFTRPDFLLTAGLLGLLCALLRRRSGSIWTAVALHWGAVLVWKVWLGGPRLLG